MCENMRKPLFGTPFIKIEILQSKCSFILKIAFCTFFCGLYYMDKPIDEGKILLKNHVYAFQHRKKIAVGCHSTNL